MWKASKHRASTNFGVAAPAIIVVAHGIHTLAQMQRQHPLNFDLALSAAGRARAHAG
ncbi:MAG: hypothetical protein R2855_04705 [Thermomicrobiales bacterium]